jgi:hypothetical protein
VKNVDDAENPPPPGPPTGDTITRDLETAIQVEIRRIIDCYVSNFGLSQRQAAAALIRTLKDLP